MTTDIRGETIAPAEARSRIAAALERYRAGTKRMIEPLSYEDLHRQHNSLMSPLVWDVGHVGNFEELWLLREIDGRAPE